MYDYLFAVMYDCDDDPVVPSVVYSMSPTK